MKQASKQKLRQDCLGSNKTLADLFTNYFRILPKLLAELQENHLKVLKETVEETVAWRTERKKHPMVLDRKSTRLNSSHVKISYAVFCLKKKKIITQEQ